MHIIRKIIIGKEITTDAMNYAVGKKVFRGQYTIESIMKEPEGFVIYINKDGEILRWKEISYETPTTIEYSLDFS